MEDTLEKRILKSNLSDEDKIEIIRRLNSKEYIYVPQRVDCPVCPTYPQPIGTPSNPWYTNQPYCYCEAKC
jgi:hypothetical protein